MQPWRVALGIDLGTTHTVAVVTTSDGRSQPLLFDSSPLLSSAVFGAEDGRLIAGRDAERGGQLMPERLEPNPKRRIDDGSVLLGAQEYPVVDLLAAVLRRVVDDAVRVAGVPTEVVLTHPATWGAPRKQILAAAAAAVGLRGVTLVPEPVAAAVYFTTVLQHAVPAGHAVVVFDLGAGTFDTSVVRRGPGGTWQVLSADGADDVGGLDIDLALIEWIGRPLTARDPGTWRRLVHPGPAADQHHRLMLRAEARTAKEQLSRQASATIRVPLFDVDVPVTREEFERLARPFLEQAVALTATTLFRAGLRPDEIAGLFLVGGSSRIPLAGTLLHQRLGIAPTLIEQPELVVALGSVPAAAQPVTAPAAADPFGVPGPVSGPPDPSGVSMASGVPAPPGFDVAAMPRFAPPAGRPRRRRGGRLGPLIVAVVVLLVAGLVAYISSLPDNGKPQQPGSGSTVSAGSGAAPGAVVFDLSRVVYYGGLKITFTKVAYTPPAAQSGNGKLTAAVKVENLSVYPLTRYVFADYASDTGQHTRGQLLEIGQVPGKEQSQGTFIFTPRPEAVGDPRAGVISIGDGNEVKAVVPLSAAGEAVALEPKVLVTDVEKTAGQLKFERITCDVRADLVDGSDSNDAHGQAKDGFRFVACRLDVRPLGNVGYGGQSLGRTNFQLKQPDGDTLAPDGQPSTVLSTGAILHDRWIWFSVRTPLQAGNYVVQFLYRGRSNNEPPTTAEIPVTLT